MLLDGNFCICSRGYGRRLFWCLTFLPRVRTSLRHSRFLLRHSRLPLRHSRESGNPDKRLTALDSRLTARGICIKRNVVLVLTISFIIFATVIYGSALWSLFSMRVIPNTVIGTIVNVVLHISFLWGLYAVFCWIVSKAIRISWDESSLEQTPPKIPLSQWNESELRPERRRQILVDNVFLLCMIPLALILFSFGSRLIHGIMFPNSLYPIMPIRNLETLIIGLVALVVLTVLWCSYNPSKRLLGFARLFLVSGFLTFCFLEYQPLCGLATKYFLHDFFSWLREGIIDNAPQSSHWEVYFKRHLTAGTFLVYSLLAAAFCYLLRAGER